MPLASALGLHCPAEGFEKTVERGLEAAKMGCIERLGLKVSRGRAEFQRRSERVCGVGAYARVV